MLRSAVAIILGTLVISWAGLPHNASLREQLVLVKMADGQTLLVSQFEVTAADWQRCVHEKGCSYHPPGGGRSNPQAHHRCELV